MGRLIHGNNNSEIDGLKKGPWSQEEDRKLIEYIQKNNGQGSWQLLPKKAGLNRCGKSCRLRWTNYLRPDIKRGHFSPQEEQTIIDLHSALGNKWSMIANRLPGRTDNEIKNFWNTHLKKKLIKSGIDPITHQLSTHLSFIHTNPLENLAKILLLLNTYPMLPSILNNFNGISHDNSFNMASIYHQPIMESFQKIPALVQDTRETQRAISNYDELFWSSKNGDISEFNMVDDEGTSSFWKDVFDESFVAPLE